MSLHALTLVWSKSRQKGNALLLLLALADWADESGECWGTLGTLAQKTRVTKKTIRALLDELVNSGEISIQPRGGKLIPAARGYAAFHSDKYVINEVRKLFPHFREAGKLAPGSREKSTPKLGNLFPEVGKNADAIRVDPELEPNETKQEPAIPLKFDPDFIYSPECQKLHNGKCKSAVAHYWRRCDELKAEQKAKGA